MQPITCPFLSNFKGLFDERIILPHMILQPECLLRPFYIHVYTALCNWNSLTLNCSLLSPCFLGFTEEKQNKMPASDSSHYLSLSLFLNKEIQVTTFWPLVVGQQPCQQLSLYFTQILVWKHPSSPGLVQ